MSEYQWSSKQSIQSLSKEPIGVEFAKKIALKLMKDADGSGIWNCHRDYCGHGLAYVGKIFYLIEVYDGYFDYSDKLKSWFSLDDFCAWLTNLSDHSLSGADERYPELFAKDGFGLNNQRLTKQRLEDYLVSEL